jgi:beta-N-acetylhexosaminidase
MADSGLTAPLTLEQKVWQTLIVGFGGTTLTPKLKQLIQTHGIGGVTLFDRNIKSPRQLAALISDIQQVAKESGQVGPFIAIDQEGGQVSRLWAGKGFTEFPSPMALAATGDVENARRIAEVMADELKALGVNLNFAPVLDVNNNPANPIVGTRSFSSDPYRVADFGSVFAAALQSQNILAVGKHFPGHGDTALDSHAALPTVTHNRAHLEAVELIPFKACIACDIAGIMSAHVAFPAMDPAGRPATLSPPILTGLLRQELGFGGLICTDSLEMGALATIGHPPPLAAATALQAGADLLLFNHQHANHDQAFDLILNRVRSGEISPARIEEAVRRILAAKKRFGVIDPAPIDLAQAAARMGTAEHRAIIRKIAAQAITLLRDDFKALPLAAGTQSLVIEIPAAAGLGERLGAPVLPIGDQPSLNEITSIVAAVRADQAVVVGVADVLANPQQVKLVNALRETKAPVIVVGLRSPYDLLPFAHMPTLLAAYGANGPMLDAVASVLTGIAKPQGRLPVKLPTLYQLNYGLTNFVSHR